MAQIQKADLTPSLSQQSIIATRRLFYSFVLHCMIDMFEVTHIREIIILQWCRFAPEAGPSKTIYLHDREKKTHSSS